VRLALASGGDLTLTRSDARLATLSRPGQPDRRVALARRPTSELIAEELRRLDPDEIYASALRHLANGAK
jgi:glucose-6-phosphate dehydrogenase assembly protein OpcA